MDEYGYAGKILEVDLTEGKYRERPTAGYATRFLGGRGLAGKLYWDTVPPEARALDPENCLIYVNGPTAGFTGLAGNRWQVCGKTPAHDPEAFSNGNMGGKWGTTLKYAGYDALAVRGRAEKPVYLFIHDNILDIKAASDLWGQSAFDTQDSMRNDLGKEISVLAIGPAAENLVPFSTILADEGASGSSGLGAVMGSKRLKAVVVAGNKEPKAAEPGKLAEIAGLIRQMRPPPGSRPSPWAVEGITFTEDCWGCGIGCNRQMYLGEKGRRYKCFCQASHIYQKASMEYHGKWNEAELLAIRLCDTYSLDTAVMAPLIAWVIACYREGILTEEQTGLPLSKAGSAEFIEIFTRKIALREGFGDVLAAGPIRAADTLGDKAKNILADFVATRANECKDYDPRLFITTALLYATAPRRPINELHGISNIVLMWMATVRGDPKAFFSTDDFREAASRFWGGEVAADFSTLEGKTRAAKIIQDRAMAKESLILCDLIWPMMWANYSGGHVGDPTLESRIYSAITGNTVDEGELRKIGERIFNLQRAIQLRHGWAGRDDDRLLDYIHEQPLKKGEIFFDPDALLPGPDGETISRIGAVLDRKNFEQLKDEYYTLRGWEVNSGKPTREKLNELELGDVAADLAARGLLGGIAELNNACQ
jgi:aldehyde:ferredoxin oxidoreductase